MTVAVVASGRRGLAEGDGVPCAGQIALLSHRVGLRSLSDW